MALEKRRYKRLSTNLIARIRGRRPSHETASHIQSSIKNISHGGVFIETSTPFSIGMVVEIAFRLPGTEKEVLAKGVVRWSGTSGKTTGMGIEFLEVSVPTRTNIDRYIGDRLSQEGVESLLRSDLHRALLRMYARKVGESFSLDVLAAFLKNSHDEVLEVLQDFQREGLIDMQSDTEIRFVQTTGDYQKTIEEWVETQEKQEKKEEGEGGKASDES